MVNAGQQDDQRFTAKGRATRDRILRIAAELIIREGLSALNMDAVRKAASVSGSQLAHYFTDKQSLIRAVVVREMDVVLDFHRRPELGGLASFDDFERWIDLNMRYLRRIGYTGTPTYHALAGQLGKSDSATRQTLASGYSQWIDLLERAIQQMRDHGFFVAGADPRRLALVVVSAHQGGATLAFSYQAEWPHADATRFAVNYLRMFAAARADRVPRPAKRPRVKRATARPARPSQKGAAPSADDATSRLTRKGRATRARIIDAAARLMFEHGVGRTSIEEVRDAAAASGSQISHYFDSKRDLTRSVIGARRDLVREFHTQPSLGALDSFAALDAWVEAVRSDLDPVYRLGGCVYGSLAGELVDADTEIHADLADGYDQWIELFCSGLTEMRRRGELRPDADPRHLAVALVAAHQGGALLTFVADDPEPMRSAVVAAVDYVRSFSDPP